MCGGLGEVVKREAKTLLQRGEDLFQGGRTTHYRKTLWIKIEQTVHLLVSRPSFPGCLCKEEKGGDNEGKKRKEIGGVKK